jgi:hypothetical protein
MLSTNFSLLSPYASNARAAVRFEGQQGDTINQSKNPNSSDTLQLSGNAASQSTEARMAELRERIIAQRKFRENEAKMAELRERIIASRQPTQNAPQDTLEDGEIREERPKVDKAAVNRMIHHYLGNQKPRS